MTKTLIGAAAALLVFASPARAADEAEPQHHGRPDVPAQPRGGDADAQGDAQRARDRLHDAEGDAHRAMHDAMMKHAGPPPHLASMPDHALHAAEGQGEALAHRRAAEQVAQRHAAMQHDRQRDRTRDPAHHDAQGGSPAGAMGEHGAGWEGGTGSCDSPAGHMQTIGHHGGPGGMMDGGHTDGGGMAPGSGTGSEPHVDGHMGGR